MSDEKNPASQGREGLNRRAFLASSAGVAMGVSLGWVAGCEAPTSGEKVAGDGGAPDVAKHAPGCAPGSDGGKAVAFAPESITQDDKAHPYGVQAGVVTANSALLWTFAEDAKPRHLRVWRESSEAGKIVEVYAKDATPKDGFFHVPVEGLAAGEVYHYAFFDAAEAKSRSRIGRFRAALPETCKEPLTIGATACTHVKRFPVLKSLQYMAKQDIDLFVHMGDMSYNDGATTAKEYDDVWRKTLTTPGYPEIFARCGIYATWDDHETTDNSDLYDLPDDHRKRAREAYLARVAQPRHDDLHFWGSYRWGHTAEFFVLDCRGERSTNPATYISKAQMDWLKKSLSESPCHFKVILNSVPIIAMPPIWKVVKDDRWEGYPKQRDELLDHITGEKIKNVWFLGGDYHIGVVAQVEKEGPRSSMYEILVGPGGNRLPDAFVKLLGANEENKEQFAPADQFPYFKPKVAATLLTFDPVQDHVHVRFIDPETDKPLYDEKLKQKA